MKSTNPIIKRARQAAHEAFPFRDAYNEEDTAPVADAALRMLLEDLENAICHVGWNYDVWNNDNKVHAVPADLRAESAEGAWRCLKEINHLPPRS